VPETSASTNSATWAGGRVWCSAAASLSTGVAHGMDTTRAYNRRMTKKTGKRGTGRDTEPAKPGATRTASGKGRKGSPPASSKAANRAPGHGGSKAGGAGAQPAWMPDPGLLRAMKPRGADAARGNETRPMDKPAPGKQASAPRAASGGAGGFVDPQAAREAGRYENPIPSREAILQVLSDAEGPLDAERLQQV